MSPDSKEPRQDVQAILVYLHSEGIAYPVGVNQSGEQWGRFQFNDLPHAVPLDAAGRVSWSRNLVVYDLEKHLARELGEPDEREQGRHQRPALALASKEVANAVNCRGGDCAPR